ncbi:MAG: hypothetical protein JST81_09435 [Bacteroidetes bacterium]|nr:hypothetical protein [Bacteroidota bacterium]
MLSFIKKNKVTIAGILIGIIAGFIYWKMIGCANGKCMITSNPVNTMLYGGLMGGLLFNIFQPTIKKQP